MKNKIKFSTDKTRVSFDWFELLELKIMLESQIEHNKRFEKEYNMTLKEDYIQNQIYEKIKKAYKTY